jgi:AcrR family transcriptional regulator
VATQQERRESTRQRIVDAADSLFMEHGYSGTSVADIQVLAGVSRGAFYHHFAAKEDVFAAVFSQTSAEAVRRAGTNIAPGSTAEDSLIAGCLGWLSAVEDEQTRRLLLIDGPAALGWERARSIEEVTSVRVVRQALQGATAKSGKTGGSIDLIAKLITAALAEAALSTQPGDQPARKRAEKLLTAIIRALIAA